MVIWRSRSVAPALGATSATVALATKSAPCPWRDTLTGARVGGSVHAEVQCIEAQRTGLEQSAHRRPRSRSTARRAGPLACAVSAASRSRTAPASTEATEASTRASTRAVARSRVPCARARALPLATGPIRGTPSRRGTSALASKASASDPPSGEAGERRSVAVMGAPGSCTATCASACSARQPSRSSCAVIVAGVGLSPRCCLRRDRAPRGRPRVFPPSWPATPRRMPRDPCVAPTR